MAILLALGAAVTFGAADFLGGVASRRSHALAVTVLAQAGGLVILVPALTLLPGAPSRAALGWGSLAGLSSGLSLVLFYHALARGPMAIVSPITAVLAAALPVAAGLRFGERPGALAWAGIVIGLLSVAAMSWSRSEPTAGRRLIPLAAALLAGIGFGVFFVGLDRAPDGSGLWPLAAARMASLSSLALILTGPGLRWRSGPVPTRLALASGLLDMSANVLFLLAVRRGDLALVAVLSALYPSVTVGLSFLVQRDRVGPVQLVGIVLALVAVVMIAAG
jgi:uncharacterized membrane protein